MKMKKSIIRIITLLSIMISNAQDSHKAELWGGYITKTKISKKISLWNDTHFASESFFILRHGLNYHIDKNVVLTGGYAWLYTATSFSNHLTRFEHRPWAQIDIRIHLGEKLRYSYRVRYDYRIRKEVTKSEVLDDFMAYHRIRFMNGIQIPITTLSNGDKIDFNIIDEILFNLGDEIKGKNFDQNRIWLLVGFSPIKNIRTMAGYVNRMSPASTPNNFNYRHGFAVSIIHSFDLTEKQGSIVP